MTRIKLHDFDDQGPGDDHRSFDLDLATGEYEVVDHPDWRSASEGAHGFAQMCRVGVRRPQQIFVAEFSWEGELHLRVGERSFVWPGPCRARQRKKWLDPFKQFRVEEGPTCHLVFWYRRYSGGSWPPEETLDIFAHIAKATKTPESIQQFSYYHQGSPTVRMPTAMNFTAPRRPRATQCRGRPD